MENIQQRPAEESPPSPPLAADTPPPGGKGEEALAPLRPHGPWYRRPRVIFLLLAALGLTVAGGLAWRWYFTTPEPPEAPRDLLDPAVAEAVREARRNVLREPRSSLAWGHLGMVFQAHGFLDQANTCFVHAALLDPEDRRWPYYLGNNLSTREPERAIRYLRRAVELSDAGHFETRLRLAEELLELGGQKETKKYFTEAEQYFNEVLARQPDCLPAHLGLGKLAVVRREWEKSLAPLKRAAEGPETRRIASRLLSTAYRRLGRGAEAEAATRRAEELPGDVPWRDPLREAVMERATGKQVRLAHADGLSRQGRFEEALAIEQDVMRSYPGDPRLYGYLFRELYALGRFDEAKKIIAEAVARHPNLIQPHFFLGQILFHEAERAEQQPAGPSAAREKYLAAAACFLRVTRLKPDAANAHLNLGWCYQHAGQGRAAEQAFRAALRWRPYHAETHLALAALLIRRGADAEALLHLRYALQAAPSADPKALRLLVPLLARTLGRG